MEVLVDALGGQRRTASVHDPVGRPIEASFGLLRERAEIVGGQPVLGGEVRDLLGVERDQHHRVRPPVAVHDGL